MDFTKPLLALLDVVLLPFVYPAALLLKAIRRVGVARIPFCKRALLQTGVFPIRNHYYEPLFDSKALHRRLDQDRQLPGIDWNANAQLQLLERFNYNDELRQIPAFSTDSLTFYMNNRAFGSGDAEYFYNLIRAIAPRRIFEIGSGYSTLLAVQALKRNQENDPAYSCEHVCIEPYEYPWLEKTGIKVIRQRVESLDVSFFAELEANDILFIDSSHVIRPQGDVLFEYLEVLPLLKPGVIVHIHDIFSPKDYGHGLIVEKVLFWNEQYLLEAFLTGNREWKIIGALNYLRHHHYDQLQARCPFLTRDREPASFYIQRIAGEYPALPGPGEG